MKRFLSVTLALAMLCGLTACNSVGGKTASRTSKPTPSQNVSSKEEPSNSEASSSGLTSSFEEITDFDSFVDKIEENNDIEVNEQEDGGIKVEINSPTDDDDDAPKPAIPTIDQIVKPTSTPTPEPEPEPTPTPTPEPEPEPTPTPTPTPEPEPQPPVVDTKAPYRGYSYTKNQKHTALSSTDRYLYSILSSEQKEWYRAIDKAVENFEKEVIFNVDISQDRKYYIYFMYMFDHPEHFYLGNTCSIYKHGNGTSSISLCYSDGVEYCAYGHTPSSLTPELKASILAKKAASTQRSSESFLPFRRTRPTSLRRDLSTTEFF